MYNSVHYVDPSGYGFRKWFRAIFAAVAAVVATILTGGQVEVGAAVFQAIFTTAAAFAGDRVGAAVDRAQSNSKRPQSSEGSPNPALGARLGPSSGTSFAPLTEADIVASETLQDSWGPDDAIFLLTGLGVSAKAAVTAAREFGPAVLFGLRSLGETGAIRLGAGEGIETLAESHITRSGRTVLGRFPQYIQKARARGASYFDIGEAWKGLSNNAERWGANKYFLDMIVSYRDRVLLSLPKGEIRAGSWLAREVEYLTKKKGYRWINQWALGPK